MSNMTKWPPWRPPPTMGSGIRWPTRRHVKRYRRLAIRHYREFVRAVNTLISIFQKRVFIRPIWKYSFSVLYGIWIVAIICTFHDVIQRATRNANKIEPTEMEECFDDEWFIYYLRTVALPVDNWKAIWQRPWTLATACMVHINVLHFILNTFAVLCLVYLLDGELKRPADTILVFFLVGGTLANVATVFLYHFLRSFRFYSMLGMNEGSYMVGASSGIMVLYGWYSYLDRPQKRYGEGIMLLLKEYLCDYLYIELFDNLWRWVYGRRLLNVSHAAHIFGACIGWIAATRLDVIIPNEIYIETLKKTGAIHDMATFDW